MTGPHRGSSIGVVTELLRESLRKWFDPADDAYAPMGGRVRAIELWPGSNMQLPAAPAGRTSKCHPVASIQVVDVYPSTAASFPEVDDGDNCGAGTAVTLLVGVWRCGYTLESNGARVSDRALERWTKITIDDEWRLRHAVCAALSAARAAPPSPRAVGGGPVAAATSIGTWSNDETAGGWLGSSRECRFLVADGWA